MADSELMEKEEVMEGRADSIIEDALNGRAIYMAEFGTTVLCALVATFYRCMYMVKARYNDGKYNVEVTRIDPSYKDFGVTYYGTVDKDSMPSKEEWKAREKPKMNICIMCICTDKSYFLEYEYDNGEHATVAFNNHAYASVKEGSCLIANYAGPVTFDSYVNVVLSMENARKNDEEALTADHITTHLAVICKAVVHLRTAYIGIFDKALYLCLEDNTNSSIIVFTAVCIDRSSPRFGAFRKDAIKVNSKTKWMVGRKIIFAPNDVADVAINRSEDNPDLFIFYLKFPDKSTGIVFLDASGNKFGEIVEANVCNTTVSCFVDYLESLFAPNKKAVAAKMLTPQDMDRLNKVVENSKHISWNVYFMAIAKLASKRSKDPRTKVGAVIVTPDDNRIVSVGYNGFPYGCSDEEFPWVKGEDLDLADTKYAYVVHAELNAILSARGRDLTGCHIYVTSSPCNECTKAIIQVGIKKIVYMEEYNPGSSGWVASSKMCKAAGVEMELYKPEGIDIDLGRL